MGHPERYGRAHAWVVWDAVAHGFNPATDHPHPFTIAGRAFPEPARVPLGVPLRCTQVACGRKHVLALMEGGFVMSWGRSVISDLNSGAPRP